MIGASGAVGSAAVQLARMKGCHVTAVTSGTNAQLVKSLGANRVVDYRSESLGDLEPFDLVIETVDRTPNGLLRTLVKPGGHLILVSAGVKDMLLASLRARRWGVSIYTGVASVKAEDMELFRTMIESGEYKPVLEKVYAFEDVVEAHGHAEAGHKQGNIALKIV